MRVASPPWTSTSPPGSTPWRAAGRRERRRHRYDGWWGGAVRRRARRLRRGGGLRRPGMSVTYRLRQFLSAITAHVSPIERALAVEQLTPGELLLFERMSLFDQRHCLDVFHTL